VNSEKASREIEIISHWDRIGHLQILEQYETGTGDYTKERDSWLKDIDIESTATELDHRRKTCYVYLFLSSPPPQPGQHPH
jgi:hypothetical protein